VRLALLTGGARSKARRETLDALQRGESDILVGTHALIQNDVAFGRLALVVVDEQHKFGVLQRAALRAKGLHPDMLVMSATPIPRTLTMTLLGDLDVSVLDELPPGRRPVETVLCAEGDRRQAYDWVLREIAKGRRVYHVAPLVEESEELPLKAAVQLAEQLRETVFGGIGVGLLHGRMSGKEKDAAMQAFRDGATPVLVCTSVVEVGVDVPEATVLIVEHAERFGLAQLHQLRGRIGRGRHPGRMLVFSDARTESGRERLNALAATTDGFEIAEADLRIRGPGEFLGTRQSGMPELRIASLVGSVALLAEAREDAFELVRDDPGLEGPGAPAARALRQMLAARPG
jgi:ATP-dependent DNA helicase RecG